MTTREITKNALSLPRSERLSIIVDLMDDIELPGSVHETIADIIAAERDAEIENGQAAARTQQEIFARVRQELK
jgi:Na+/phosphate symporter